MIDFTIIIPVKEINDYLKENVPIIQNLNKKNWELIILPNESEDSIWNDKRVRVKKTGRVSPARKRDIGANLSRGKYLVFLDDDSFPEANYLSVAEKYIKKKDIAAIGGPGITPKNNNFFQRVSGAVFLSKFSGGFPERYISVKPNKKVDDWPSVNLIVKKDDFIKAGGFDSNYWPGEDTKFCSDLIKKTKKSILYVSNLIVWHHRRSSFIKHLIQISNYGFHRGYFVRKIPHNSRKIIFFLPSAFFLLSTLSFLEFFLLGYLNSLFFSLLLIYSLSLLLSFKDIIKHENLSVALVSIFYIVLTHFFYGLNFIKGILYFGQLKSKLR